MSAFDDLIDEIVGGVNDTFDIEVVVRRLWFYDFVGHPLRLWQGKGKLFTSDGNEWLGTIDAGNTDHHETPAIQDGRDGSSATYTMSLTIPDLPGENPGELYAAIKADQSLVAGRNVTCYLAIFKINEALRPTTPISYLKQLNLFAPKFAEKLEMDGEGRVKRVYTVSITAKDSNFGRSSFPNGTYTDTVQKNRAALLGQAVDKGCEYVALLANKTLQIP